MHIDTFRDQEAGHKSSNGTRPEGTYFLSHMYDTLEIRVNTPPEEMQWLNIALHMKSSLRNMKRLNRHSIALVLKNLNLL